MSDETSRPALNQNIIEKIEGTVCFMPIERYSEIFFEETKRLQEELETPFKDLPWKSKDTNGIFEALKWSDEEVALRIAAKLVEKEKWQDTTPDEIVNQHKQYIEAKRHIEEEIYKRSIETTPEQWFDKAEQIVNIELPLDNLKYIRRQYEIAQSYLDDTNILKAEANAYKAVMYDAKNTRNRDSANEILDTKKFPDILREDEDVLQALEVVTEHSINLFLNRAGQGRGNPFVLKYLIERIDNWRKLWPEKNTEAPGYEQNHPKLNCLTVIWVQSQT